MTADPGSPAPSRARRRPDLDLLVLCAAVVLINLPYLRSRFVPAHDTNYVFGIFTYFYNHFLVEHELPRWMAYGTCGFKSAVFQVDFLSATSYVFIAVGALFKVQNPLLLFTMSIIGEQLLFLLGVYLLSRRLFADRLTVLIVGFGAVFGVVWYWQLFLNFRMFHLLPLALYFVERFSAEKRPEFLWMSGVTLLFSALGCPPYFYPLLALTLGMFALVLGSSFRRALPSVLERSARNGLAFGLFALTAAALALTFHQALEGIEIVALGRDAASGKVELSAFLTYGGTTSPQILGSFFGVLSPFGDGAHRELTHYIGLIPLAALPVALIRCRQPVFIALVTTAGLLLLLSLGGTFACLVYRLPLMNLVRHVGYLTSLSKVLLLLASGFGIERMLSALSSGLRWERRARFGALAALVLGLWILLDAQIGGDRLIPVVRTLSWGQMDLENVRELLAPVLRVLAFLGAGVAALWPSRAGGLDSAVAPGTLRRVLLAAALIDGLSYQAQIIAAMPGTREELPIPVGTIAYRERRGGAIDPRVERVIEDWKDLRTCGAAYHIALCAMFQLDPDKPLAREDWFSRPATRLKSMPEKSVQKALPELLGVAAPKLRLMSRAVGAADDAEARKAVAGSPDPGSRVVLLGATPPMESSRPPDGMLRVKEFSANRLLAEVTVHQDDPLWLVYADSVHPGWRATVDGAPAPILEANLAFKAVRVEKGVHAVAFSFHDGPRTLGAQALAFFSAIFTLAGLLALLYRIGWGGEPPPSGEAKSVLEKTAPPG